MSDTRMNYERAVLSVMLNNTDFRDEVIHNYEPDIFRDYKCRQLFTCLQDMDEQGIYIDEVSIHNFNADKKDKGESYDFPMTFVVDIKNEIQSKHNAKHNLAKVIEYKIKYDIAKIIKSKGSIDEIYNTIVDMPKVNQTEMGIFEGQSAVTALSNSIKESKREAYGKTGIEKIDYLTGGLLAGSIYTLSAGSGVGKSMFGMQVFHESMLAGNKVLYISNEMLVDKVIARMISRITNLNALDILQDKIKNKTLISDTMTTVANLMSNTGSIIVDKCRTPELTYKAINEYAGDKGCQLVIIDHLHRIRDDKKEIVRLADMANKLQDLIQEYRIAGLFLAQLRKADRKNPDFETVTARGTSVIEDISNVQIIMNRTKIETDEYDADLKDHTDIDFYINKNRDGGTGTVEANVSFPSMVIS